MTLRERITRIQMTYEALGFDEHVVEYKRAISAALCGDDPTLQMSPAAQKIFESLPVSRPSRCLTKDGHALHQEITKLHAAIEDGGDLIENAVNTCNLVLTAAVFYTQKASGPAERMVLARSLTSTVLTLIAKAEGAETSSGDPPKKTTKAFEKLRKHLQDIHVSDPQSREFSTAVDNVVHLRDYLDSH